MEKSVNRVEITGTVGVDPKITTFEDGRQVLRMAVATEEGYKDRSGEWKLETTWHSVVAWSGKEMPDFALIKKGQRVAVQGKIKNKSFEGRDGQTKYYYEVLAFSLKLLDAEESD
ncbi:MAG: single-stranded DNA-binding protein [Bacteroidales bacterium]|nr:single-stranded DNA-binding protein [Bacteroidales bacterium]MCL2738228.1 single-stranded DNA-binding protein [Bacteroidales bacterium]